MPRRGAPQFVGDAMRANWISAQPALEPQADGPSLVVTFENGLFRRFATPNVWCDALRAHCLPTVMRPSRLAAPLCEGIRWACLFGGEHHENAKSLGRDRLVAVWRTLTAHADRDGRVEYKVDPLGQVVDHRRACPWHQLLVTDMFCQLAAQLGHRLAMRQPVTTRSFGIRIVDVVWMPEEKWPRTRRYLPFPTCASRCSRMT